MDAPISEVELLQAVDPVRYIEPTRQRTSLHRVRHTGMKFLVEEHARPVQRGRDALSEFGGYTHLAERPEVRPDPGRRETALPYPTRRSVAREVMRRRSCVVPLSEKLGMLLSRLASRRLPVHITPVARLMLESMATGTSPSRAARDPWLVHAAAWQAASASTRRRGANARTPRLQHRHAYGIRGGTASNVDPDRVLDRAGRTSPSRVDRPMTSSPSSSRLPADAPRSSSFPRSRGSGQPGPLADASSHRRHDGTRPGMRTDPDAAPGLHRCAPISAGSASRRMAFCRCGSRRRSERRSSRRQRAHPGGDLEFGTNCLLDVINRYR